MKAITSQVTLEAGAALDEITYEWETTAAPEASPASGPSWLRATDGVDPRIPPVHYLIARHGPGQLAAVPAYLIPGPLTPDADPRSYFGASQETTAGPVCCGSAQTSPAAQAMASLDPGDVFPALLLGSIPGYKTEILHSYWTPGLAASLVDAAIAYARDHQYATIIAPWIADQGSGRALGRELQQRGAVAAYWAAENYIPLRHGTLQAHLAAGRKRDRYRYNHDMHTAQALGLDIRTLTRSELRDSLDRVGHLVAANRRRYGYDISENDVPMVLRRLLDMDVPLICTAGFKAGQLVVCCVSVEKAGRVYAKYAGFDYDILGTRSGAHFAVVLYATLAAAYEHHAHLIEYGVGARQAKALRGCQPRTVTSYVLTTRPHVRETFAAAAALSAPGRRAEYGSSGQAQAPPARPLSIDVTNYSERMTRRVRLMGRLCSTGISEVAPVSIYAFRLVAGGRWCGCRPIFQWLPGTWRSGLTGPGHGP